MAKNGPNKTSFTRIDIVEVSSSEHNLLCSLLDSHGITKTAKRSETTKNIQQPETREYRFEMSDEAKKSRYLQLGPKPLVYRNLN